MPATGSRRRPGNGPRPAVADGSSPRSVRPAPEARPARATMAARPPTPRPSCPTDTGAPDRDDRPRCRRVREAIARHGGRVEINGLGRVQQRQQGLREPLGMGSHPRATKGPCPHARSAGRSPDQELCSIYTFQDPLRCGCSISNRPKLDNPHLKGILMRPFRREGIECQRSLNMMPPSAE